jgi:hypothetical protein
LPLGFSFLVYPFSTSPIASLLYTSDSYVFVSFKFPYNAHHL